MKCQRNKFSLPKDITYLNGAYMSPLLKKVEKIGKQAVEIKSNPTQLSAEDFFSNVDVLKKSVSKLINNKAWQRISIIPSTSYGISNTANNIDFKKGDEILLLGDQFPSNYYIWQRIAEQKKCVIKVVDSPKTDVSRGEKWNIQILNNINKKTKVVAMSQVHWADGTLFDLGAIRSASRAHDALLIIDGTQSIGALPFDVKKLKPDALICSAYKWLMGPYAIGFSYYGEYFDDGIPIEESWMIRKDSHVFSELTNYQSEYRPLGAKYDVGQTSNFILVPMMVAGIQQLIKWKPKNIQDYTDQLSKKVIKKLRGQGYWVEDNSSRAKHLFGIKPPDGTNLMKLKKKLEKEKLFVSIRAGSVRVSPNVYNDKNDMVRLCKVLLKK